MMSSGETGELRKMRERSTWLQNKNAQVPRHAATSRKAADIYDMNDERQQPGHTDYESGNPDEWAESLRSPMAVEDEYDGDVVKRNELGMGEFRDDTWKHKDSAKWNDGKKYDNRTAAIKSRAAHRLAGALLRTENKELVESVASDFMNLPVNTLLAAVKKTQQASPDALSNKARFRRAMSCTKLAARLIGKDADPSLLHRLASYIMNVDDPTLKGIISVVAAVRVAAEDDEEDEKDEKDKTSSSKKDDEKEEKEDKKSASPKKDDEKKEDKKSEEKAASPKKDEDPKEDKTAHGITTEDLRSLEQMIKEELGEVQSLVTQTPQMTPVAPPVVSLPPSPAPPPAGEGLGDLFDSPPQDVPMVDASACSDTPMLASNLDEYSNAFNDAEPEDPTMSAQASSLDDIFSDEPEVVASRELSHQASGFNRTASSKGAKKIGQVTPSPSKVAGDLDGIWKLRLH
jgi:hypothetical protein